MGRKIIKNIVISEKLKLAYKEGRRTPNMYWLGKKRPEYGKLMSKLQKGKPNLHLRGEKNHMWKGGISKSKYYNNVIYQKKYRHRKGISKKYNSELGISYTKGYRKLQGQKYKASKKAGGKLPLERIQRVYEDNIKKYGTLTCYLCEKPTPFGKDNLEHKIPLSRGGTNKYDNLAIACQKCNYKKHNKTEQEYREEKKL